MYIFSLSLKHTFSNPWSKCAAAWQKEKDISTIYRTRKLTAVFTRPHHPRSNEFRSHNLISVLKIHFNIIPLYTSVFQVVSFYFLRKILLASVTSPRNATCNAHLMIFNVVHLAYFPSKSKAYEITFQSICICPSFFVSPLNNF
jgi:hypothetical protein